MRIKNYFLAGAALLAVGTINAQEYVSPAENVAVGKTSTASSGTASSAFDEQYWHSLGKLPNRRTMDLR